MTADTDTTDGRDEFEYAPAWDGQTFNGVPYVEADADLTVNCGRHRAHESIREDCGWSGPVSETTRGKSKMGSKPRSLLCPECGWSVAAERGTTGAGHWGNALDG